MYHSRHFLSECSLTSVKLTQGQFTWRHRTFLRELADVAETDGPRKRNSSKTAGGIRVIMKDVKPENKKYITSVFDTGGRDWDLRMDLDM